MRRLALSLPLALLFTVACSAPAPEPAPAPRLDQKGSPIIGGVVDNGVPAHDAVVLLYMSSQGGSCTGSLIAPNLVLTARHCVSINISEGIGCDPEGNSTNGDHVSSDFSPSSIEIYTGTNPPFWLGKAAAYGKKIFHPDGYQLCNKDIALVLLDKPVDLAPPVKLRLNFGAQIGELTTAIGYGKTSDFGFDSGVRYRRDNIAVLSVGRDYNYYLGENEFIMGQSTCQGDSGGPVMAGDTGAILGVTSRGSQCETGNQRFTRVDAHKALIESALAEAGATAQLEGKTAPPPIDQKATGEGPCTTGAECVGAFCYTATKTCSTLCSPGFCPSGQECQPTPIQVDQQSTDAPICRPYEAVDACDTCRHTKCKTKVEECYADQGCASVQTCASKCTTAACYDACAAKNPAGAALYKAVRDCECNSKCTKTCAGSCGKDTGAGGAAGAGGSAAGAGGSTAGAGGAEAGAGGAEAGAGGDPGEAGAGGDPGEAGAAGDGGSGEAAGAGAGGKGGKGGAGGSTTAGSGGAAAGAGGTTGGPTTQATGDSGDSGGCSASGRQAGGGWLLALGALAALNRRKKSRA